MTTAPVPGRRPFYPAPTREFLATESSANTAVTLTLPAPPVGQVHEIFRLEIMRLPTAAVTATAFLAYTTTNLPGSMQWKVGNGAVAFVSTADVVVSTDRGIKSSAPATATTIVAPAAGVGVAVRISCWYNTTPDTNP